MWKIADLFESIRRSRKSGYLFLNGFTQGGALLMHILRIEVVSEWLHVTLHLLLSDTSVTTMDVLAASNFYIYVYVSFRVSFNRSRVELTYVHTYTKQLLSSPR